VFHCFLSVLLVVPLLSDSDSLRKLLSDCMSGLVVNVDPMADLIIDRLGNVGCKTALRLTELAVATAGRAINVTGEELEKTQSSALAEILDDLAGDEVTTEKLCEIF
jgi:hypothetical protein